MGVWAQLLQEAPALRRTLYFLMERTKQHIEDVYCISMITGFGGFRGRLQRRNQRFL